MALFHAHRATDRDLSGLEQMCAEATSHKAGLWSVRRVPLSPASWIAARTPLVVASEGANVIGFAAAVPDTVPLGAARCAEAIVYVTPAHRRHGAARAAMSELVSVARTVGLWKMIAYALPDDAAARTLLERLDFRQVGVMVKHVQIESSWRDVALHERLVLAARKSLPSVSDA